MGEMNDILDEIGELVARRYTEIADIAAPVLSHEYCRYPLHLCAGSLPWLRCNVHDPEQYLIGEGGDLPEKLFSNLAVLTLHSARNKEP